MSNITRILPVLTHIQTNLDQDLSLETLADGANLSPFHFHRLFQEVIGETVKQYTQRLRLERAAYELKLRQETILDVALSNGYQNHETFSRAFKRHFGMTPKSYRRHFRLAEEPLSGPQGHLLNHDTAEFRISSVRVQALRPISVAFIRNLGPYETVDTTLFDQLQKWAADRDWLTDDSLLLAIGHDDPTVTPAEKLRYDACLEVPEPFPPDGRIGHQETPTGLFAAVTYVGPYGPVMEQAYSAIFHHMMRLKHYTLIGLPAIEIYRTTRINPSYALNETDIYLPVVKR